MNHANPVRGEAELVVAGEVLVLRPTFGALVRAEQELGSLFALVERASAGALRLEEMAGLFWHCLHQAPPAITRDQVGEALVALGLVRASPVLKRLLQQILSGQS